VLSSKGDMVNVIGKSLAIAFGGGLAFGVGMKLGQASAQPEGKTGVDLDPLKNRLDEIENHIRSLATTAAVSNASRHSTVRDSRATGFMATAFQTGVKGSLEHVDQRLTEFEEKLEFSDRRIEELASESVRTAELEAQLREVIDSSILELESRLQKDVSNVKSETIQAVSQTIETRAVRRISALERSLAGQSETVEGFRQRFDNSDRNMEKLLRAVEQLFDQTTKQVAGNPNLPGATSRSDSHQPGQSVYNDSAGAGAIEAEAAKSKSSRRKWQVAIVLSLLILAGIALFLKVPRQGRNTITTVRHPPDSLVASRSPAPQKTAPKPAVQETSKAESESEPSANIRGKVRVDLVADETTWIEAVSGGKPAFVGVLKPSQTKNLESFETIRITVGNAGGVQMRLNGKPVGRLGAHGQIRIVEFTPEGFQIIRRKSPQGISAPAASPAPLQGTGWRLLSSARSAADQK
jgi:hypothetical protein